MEGFWDRVDRSGGPTACWPWKRGRFQRGYGAYKRRGAHREAWRLTHGEIPDGLCVCHRCDNPPCCNPDHLFIGTQRDNIHDMIQKGRQQKNAGDWSRGSMNGRAKLTEREVVEIRRLRAGGMKLREVAERYQITESSVSMIARRKQWRHV